MTAAGLVTHRPRERGARRAWLGSLRDLAATFCIALPPVVAAGWTAWSTPGGPGTLTALGLGLLGSGLLAWRRERWLRRGLGALASVVAAYGEGDYSIRARGLWNVGPLADALREVNRLGEMLRRHRLGELEAWALLHKVMAEVDVVVLAFNEAGCVKLANPLAARVLGAPMEQLVGRDAGALGLVELLRGPTPRIVKRERSQGGGPWELRRGAFRLAGMPHTLVVLADVGSALRAQEREAWKQLIRVMGHEINNSLAPIQSLSESLCAMLHRSPRAGDWEVDLQSGLRVVAGRAEGLGRFMAAYAKLARLPPPAAGQVAVGSWVARVARLEQRLAVDIVGGPEMVLAGDADQLDQMLINLVKNAVEATLERSGAAAAAGMPDRAGGVRVAWTMQDRRMVEVVVDDDGPGVAEPARLFAPSFTTKPDGSGIGLVLALHIAEAHGGGISLVTRENGSGARATVRLPIGGPA